MSEVVKEIMSLEQAYSMCFKTKEGEAVLKDLERRYSIHHTTMDANPNYVMYNEGMRSVVLYIKSQIDMTKKKEIIKNEHGQL